jgi:tripartite-type tricarboxylate transporter receptor subunit TctC
MSILARMILVYIVTAPWLGTAGAQTQTTDFPNRPIRVLVPYGPGGVDY